ncbi:hypothetical protein HY418_03395 [Candidatus Kaiserbacteria bacterium]|nr:hypothetical protein [Candidatus Kaiserbacteria bacterium]
MSDEVVLDGKPYVTSRRASEISGYAQDYIGQLSRSALIEARRVGGLWYVSMPSLDSYKSKADLYVPEPPQTTVSSAPDSLLMFDGKDYISAVRASQISSYNPDYVGQLARSGKILSRQIGNRWYVDREGLLAHKREKDALLAAVQADSVGIVHSSESVPAASSSNQEENPYLRYIQDQGDLMPVIESLDAKLSGSLNESSEERDPEEYKIPIRVGRPILTHRSAYGLAMSETPATMNSKKLGKKSMFYGLLAASAFTVVIVLSMGLSSLQERSIYALGTLHAISREKLAAGAASALTGAGDVIERLLVRELVYRRPR